MDIEQCVTLTASGSIGITDYGALSVGNSDIIKAIYEKLSDEYCGAYGGKEFYGEITIVATAFVQKRLEVQSNAFAE